MSPATDERIIELWGQGHDTNAIAKQLCLSEPFVSMRLPRLLEIRRIRQQVEASHA